MPPVPPRFQPGLLFLVVCAAPPAAAQIGASHSSPRPVNTTAAGDTAIEKDVVVIAPGIRPWVAVFVSNANVGGGSNDFDLVAARSDVQGASWSAFAPIGPAGTDLSDNDLEPALACDGSFNYMVVWASQRQQGGNDYDIFSARTASTDPLVWVNALPVEQGAAGLDTVDDRNPTIAVDGGNSWVTVWERTDATTGDKDLWFARSTSLGFPWGASAPLLPEFSSDVGDDLRPRLAHDPATGVFLVVWSSSSNVGGASGTDAEILCSLSMDGGQNWSTPTLVNTSASTDGGAGDLEPVVAVSSAGWIVVAWSSNHDLGGIGTDNDILCAVSSDGGLSWGAPTAINFDAASDGGLEDTSVDLAFDLDGTLIAVWERRAAFGSDIDLLTARSNDGGLSWSAPVCANTNCASDTGNDRAPRIVQDGLGRFVLVWESTDDLGGTVGTEGDVLGAYVLDPTNQPIEFCLGNANSGTRCPCGNDSPIQTPFGCRNSVGNGAWLTSSGTAQVPGAFTLLVGSTPPSVSTLFFQGTAAVAGGDGAHFGDGLRCVGGSVIRLGIVTATPAGGASMTATSTGITPGSARFYQVWYRNAASFCTAATFNLSNGLAATWGS